MGKRKKSSRKPGGPKKRESLATTFTCLFCNHEDAVTVKMDKKNSGIGDLRCNNCHQNFQTSINYLSAPVDVFSDWIDACEAVAQDGIAQEEQITEQDKQFSTYANERPRGTAKAGVDDDEDGGYGDDDDDN